MRFIIFVFFLLSGCSALVYEVAWMRMLVLTLGVTMQATSCILAAFLGGLALGASVAGRLAIRLRASALVAYGVLELAIGILAPAVSQGMLLTPHFFAELSQSMPDNSAALLACRLAISIFLLLPPTMLMGASLPFLTRFLMDRNMSAPEFFSHLYGVNTLGGVCGSLAACFVGFPFWGIRNTILAAASINIVVGVSSILLGRRQSQSGISTGDEGGEPPSSPSGQPAEKLTWLYLISGFTGFTAISYEVLWTRMLKFATGSSTYAFTAIVAVFLAGLAVGSFVYHRLFGRREDLSFDGQLPKFALFQYLSGIACATSLLFLPASFLLFLLKFDPDFKLGAGFFPENLAPIVSLGLIACTFMFVPSVIIGISFPMITSLSTAVSRDASGAVGNAFAANTIGCVLGSAVVGLYLIPVFGSYSAFQFILVLTIVTGACAVLVSRSLRGAQKLIFAAVPVALSVFFAMFVHFPVEYFLPGTNVVRYGEDVSGTALVLGWPDHKQLIINGEPYSTTTMRGRRYMRLLGHLPALLHRNPADALVICFGMGTTAGAVSLHPEVKSLDIVELSPLVIELGTLFRETNYDVLSNPKVHVHVDDGRNFLLRAAKLYDFVTLEPPPPTDAGMTNLYSQEFYELVKQRLKPGGIVCQWLPMHTQTGRLWKMMLKAATNVFAEASLWESNNSDCVLILSSQPLNIDYQKLQRRMDDPSIQPSLKDVGLGEAASLLGTFISAGRPVREYSSDVAAVTDDRAQIEFSLPYSDERLYNYDLEPISSDVAELLSNIGTLELQKLAASRESMKLLRSATADYVKGDRSRADQLLRQAEALEPDNAYFNYAKENVGGVLF